MISDSSTAQQRLESTGPVRNVGVREPKQVRPRSAFAGHTHSRRHGMHLANPSRWAGLGANNLETVTCIEISSGALCDFGRTIGGLVIHEHDTKTSARLLRKERGNCRPDDIGFVPGRDDRDNVG